MDKKSELQKEYELMKKDVPDSGEELSRTEDVILQNFTPAAAADDCTGLMPEGGGKPDESYRELRPFAVPVRPETKKNSKK